MSNSPFAAAPSMIGYLYQVRMALFLSLKKLRDGADFLVSLETLDDVTFSYASGDPIELLQTKHQLNRQASLSDASEDLWKTLRVWLEHYRANGLPSDIILHLLTTGTAPTGSAASYLSVGADRNVERAAERLATTALTSKSAGNSPAYVAFKSFSDAEIRGVLENVFVHDNSASINDLEGELEKEIHWTAEKKYRPYFLDGLEGWWFRRCVKQLSNKTPGPILSAEVEAQMQDLREQFKRDALPIDIDLSEFTLNQETHNAHSNHLFVQQLALIKASGTRVSAAIRDYYRAFEQRSRWIRNELLMLGDLDRYEKRLIEEWELTFEAIKNELGSETADAVKLQAARRVLAWAETTQFPIRPNVTEPFVCRGSLHILADHLRIGWHPEFRALLGYAFEKQGPPE